MKKLILIMMLVFGCVIGTYAQKTVFKFRDAQARAGDAVTEVFQCHADQIPDIFIILNHIYPIFHYCISSFT